MTISLYLKVCCGILFAVVPTLFGQNAEAIGTSSITISGTQVYAFGSTQLDYTSSLYYNLGTSVALLSGASDTSLSLVSQDDELASRALVTGSVTVSVSSNTIYFVDTAHYVDLIYEVSGDYDDQYGFSLLPSEEDDTEMDLVAPDIQELTGGTRLISATPMPSRRQVQAVRAISLLVPQRQ